MTTKDYEFWGLIASGQISYAIDNPKEFGKWMTEFEKEHDRRTKRSLVTVLARRGRRLELTETVTKNKGMER
jgi:hypothetical protein